MLTGSEDAMVGIVDWVVTSKAPHEQPGCLPGAACQDEIVTVKEDQNAS